MLPPLWTQNHLFSFLSFDPSQVFGLLGFVASRMNYFLLKEAFSAVSVLCMYVYIRFLHYDVIVDIGGHVLISVFRRWLLGVKMFGVYRRIVKIWGHFMHLLVFCEQDSGLNKHIARVMWIYLFVKITSWFNQYIWVRLSHTFKHA